MIYPTAEQNIHLHRNSAGGLLLVTELFIPSALARGEVKHLLLHDTSTTETVAESVICRVSFYLK